MELCEIDHGVNYDFMTKCWESNNCVQENLTIGKSNWRYRGEGNANIVIALEDEVTIIRLSKNDSGVSWSEQHKKKVDRQVIFTRHIFAPLLGSENVAKVHAVYIENIDQLNEMLSKLRPRHRMHKGLKVPYATAHSDFARISNFSPSSNHVDYCIEIKPKKGWWAKSNTENIGDLRPNFCTYCLNQYHKLKKGKITSRSNYCPLDLFSGKPQRMVYAVMSLLSNPQNNLRIFRDGCLIYGDSRDKTLSLDTLINEWASASNTPLTSSSTKISGLNSFVYLICLALLKPLKSQAESVTADDGIHRHFQLMKKELKQLLLGHFIVEKTCGNEINSVIQDKLVKELSRKKCCTQENVVELPGGSVLSRILNAQKLEESDPSQIKKIYRKICPIHADIHCGSQLQLVKNNNKLIRDISSEDCPNNKCLSGEIWLDEVQTNGLTPKELMSLQRNLLAATVKDCSIMLTLSPIIVSSSSSASSSLSSIGSNNKSGCDDDWPVDEISGSILNDLYRGFHFSRIGIVDLDPKSLGSVVKHNYREVEVLKSYYASSDSGFENTT